ncbi:DMT family transporter [Actinopolymorpha sp. B11F2]|uniref:DMT family transporter n=1 Tax=Actinopolymorpha sp. B11F2 TaxID=3160862 RepID=UPI0032E41A48
MPGNTDGGMVTTSTRAPVPSSATRHRAVVAALVTVLLWASAFVGIRMIGTAYSPGALAFGRIAVGALVLGAFAWRCRSPLPRGGAFALVIGYGVIWFAGYTAVLNLAERHLDAGTAALLVNVAPILVAVFAGLFLGEGFARPLVIGIAIAFLGVVVIALGGSGGESVNDGIGIVLGLVTALLYAAGVLMQKVALRRVDTLTATFLGCATGAVVLLPFAPQFVAQSMAAPTSAIAAVVYLGVFPTAIAFSTWAYALARTDAGRMTATTLTVPAIAIVLSWLLLGELPTVLGMVGGALCLLGVAISRRR